MQKQSTETAFRVFPSRSRSNRPVWGVVAVLGVAVLMGIPFGSTNLFGPSTVAASLAAPVPAHEGASTPTLSGGPPASGRGFFYQGTVLPKAATAQEACYQGTCVNATTDPSMNLTSTGVLAVAYTSYSDVAACGATFSEVAVATSTDGGTNWSTPTYLNNPQCNSTQNNNSDYDNAWQPSLTSLPNGTLVLAYVQYNVTGKPAPALEWITDNYDRLTSYDVPYDRLVVTDSYDDGTTWTTPTVLNASNNPSLTIGDFWSPTRPWATAFGETVYVAWTSMGTTPWGGYVLPGNPPVGNTNVSLIVSTDGGELWGSIVNLATEQGPTTVGQGSIAAAMNPAIDVLPDGQLTIAYLGNLTAYGPTTPFCTPAFCAGTGPAPGAWGYLGGDIVVARSSNNGTSFAYSLVPYPGNEPFWLENPSAGTSLAYGPNTMGGGGGTYDDAYSFLNPAPTMAYDAGRGQLFLGFEAGNNTQVSGWYQTTTVFVTNSSNEGASWSIPRQVDPSLIQPSLDGCAYNLEYSCTSQAEGQATVVVSNGTLEVAFGYYNYSACGPLNGGGIACGMVEELVYGSSDDGQTFQSSGPTSTVLTVDDTLYAGVSASAIGTGSNLWIAWTQPWCPNWVNGTTCKWPLAGPDGPQVIVSQPYRGTGLTIRFQQTSLPSWMQWNATLGGNLRGGAGTTLSISGVPPNTPFAWSVPDVTGPYGTVFTGASNPPSPGTFTHSSTVAVTFSPAYTHNVTVSFRQNGLPSGTPWSVDFGGVTRNGSAGSILHFTGVPANASITWSLLIVPSGQYGVEYVGYAPNASSPAPFATNTTVVVNYTRLCAVGFSTDLSSAIGSTTFSSSGSIPGFNWNYFWSATSTSLWFLPAGVTYALSTGASNATTIGVQSTILPVGYWKGAGTGSYTGPGPFGNFTLNGPLNETALLGPWGTNFSVSFTAVGLPANSTYQFTLNGSQYSASAGQSVVVHPLHTGGYALSGIAATAPTSGWEYFGSSEQGNPIAVPVDASVILNFSALVDVAAPPGTVSFQAGGLAPGTPWQWGINGTTYASNTPWLNLSLKPGTYPVEGFPAIAANDSVAFAPSLSGPTMSVVPGGAYTVSFVFTYRVSAIVSRGGSVLGAGVHWVVPGGSESFEASAGSQYGFAGWQGVGPGSYSGPSPWANVTVANGPITETAVFDPLPANRFYLNFTESGIPNGTWWTVDVDGTNYASSTTSLSIADVYSCQLSGSPGYYALAVPVAYSASNGTRYVPGNYSASVCGGSLVTLTFQTQYHVTVLASPGGEAFVRVNTTEQPDSFWLTAGVLATLAVQWGSGYYFAGWIGTGRGSYSGPQPLTTITPESAITETANFQPIYPTVPPRYAAELHLTTNFAPGTAWTVTLNGTVYSSTGAWLNVSGFLAGTYPLAVASALSPDGFTEYLPVDAPNHLTIANGNVTQSLNYQTEYWVMIRTLGNGSATPGSGFYRAGDPLALSVVAGDGTIFRSWNGSGLGSYNGTNATPTIVVKGPLVEVASFTGIPSVATILPSQGSSYGTTTALLLFAGIGLVVGVAVGSLLVWRGRRGGPGRSGPPSSGPSEGSEAAEDGPADAEGPE